jgi:hypothetical protein
LEQLIFLIIIGLISTIIGKAKQTKGGPERKPMIPNQFEDIKKLFNPSVEKIPPANTAANKAELEDLRPVEQASMERKYYDIKNETEAMILSEYIDQHQISTVEPVKVTTESVKDFISENAEKKALINGIVWSEILGQPRSRKPHFARKG